MKPIVLLFFFLSSIAAFAQENTSKKYQKKQERRKKIEEIMKQEEEGVIRYRKHFVGGLKLTNDGYGGMLELGRARSIRSSLLFQLDITERKHPKEAKSIGNPAQSGPIIFGKVNYVYPIKVGVQYQYILGNKSHKNGVSVSANAGGGLAISILRPYVIEVGTGNGIEVKTVTAADTTDFLNFNNFRRGPNLFTFWSNLRAVPGIYMKQGLRFDYGKFNETVSALEIGLTEEYYAKKIDQMMYVAPRNFFIGGYVSIMFGRRK